MLDLRENLLAELHEREVRVTFTKKDGSERVMYCTLAENYLPEYEKKTDRVRKDNPDVQSVYDTDVKGWRSFRWDSVISYV